MIDTLSDNKYNFEIPYCEKGLKFIYIFKYVF